VSPPLTYAIGDIHGCHDLLLTLLQGIEGHAAGQPYRLVFLGDYIDRGPDSAGVLATVRRLQEGSPESVVCLMGNHEALMLEAATDPSRAQLWLRNGGDAALASFGINNVSELPSDIVEWVRQLPAFYEDEHHYYVHAGVNPARALSDQTNHDRFWIREAFLEAEHDFGKHIVHGHTPLQTASPDERLYRTNLDTAAVYGGALTAGVFTPKQTRAVAYLRVLANGRP
jgi:serine/threonine protein phosphatase 1